MTSKYGQKALVTFFSNLEQVLSKWKKYWVDHNLDQMNQWRFLKLVSNSGKNMMPQKNTYICL